MNRTGLFFFVQKKWTHLQFCMHSQAVWWESNQGEKDTGQLVALLLCGHVDHQVNDAVAVGELIVVPVSTKATSGEMRKQEGIQNTSCSIQSLGCTSFISMKRTISVKLTKFHHWCTGLLGLTCKKLEPQNGALVSSFSKPNQIKHSVNLREALHASSQDQSGEEHWYQSNGTYHETSLTKCSLSAIPAPASKMEEWVSPLKSVDTTYEWK